MPVSSRHALEHELKVKIHYRGDVYVIYCAAPISLDFFLIKIREACKCGDDQITLKIVDGEGDPCTVNCQNDMDEVVWSIVEARNTNGNNREMFVHVFNGFPKAPGGPCDGEEKNMYRRGARRWNKKFYNVYGHRFQPKRANLNCAICQDHIWGLGRGGLRCTDCGMCVHKKCHKFVKLQCTKQEFHPENYHQTTPTNALRSKWLDNGNAPSVPVQAIATHATNGTNGNTVANLPGIENFRFLKVIGRGSYAKVVQAEHRKTREIFAIKIIKKTMCVEEEDMDWIQTEKSVFETASNHPFLVGLHSCFQSDSRLFFVIEFIPGGDLMFHMQRQHRLEEAHARFYSAEIILALHFLHSRHIIYRDLKLDNVLLDRDGHIKLTDFGMCKENIGPGDLTNTFCGTPNYIAPEILRGEEYGFSIDYWALGVLLFEMLAGRSPFQLPVTDDERAEDHLFQVIMERQIRIPRTLTQQAAHILRGFLNKDPQARLGCKLNIEEGLSDIKEHRFFNGHLDWAMLEARQIAPPFNPDVQDDRDLRRFDTSFTDEAPNLTPDSPTEIANIDQTEFEGFEFVNPLQLGREDVV